MRSNDTIFEFGSNARYFVKKLIYIILLILSYSVSYAQSCEVEGTYFSTFEDIKTILDASSCTSCHANGNTEADWSYDDYTSFIKSGSCGQPMIIHGNAAQSYVYEVLSAKDDLCLESSSVHKLSAEKLDQIESWINHGAPEYCLPLYPEIKSIFDANNCQSCHNQSSDIWGYDTYEEILGLDHTSSCSDDPIVKIGDAFSSILYDKINNDNQVLCGAPMNGVSAPMTQEEISKVRDWINGGALESKSTLPVVLSKFNTQDIGESILLEWTTEIEIATDRFVIEHSETGRGFEPLAEVSSIGSSDFITNYNYTDDNPSYGENYYRLKMVDLDGSFTYSNIRLTRLQKDAAEMIISPNPAVSSDRLKVTWYPKRGQDQAYLNIVDPNGRSLHRKIIFEGTNYVRLPALIEGIYYVIIEDYFGGFLLERVVIIN